MLTYEVLSAVYRLKWQLILFILFFEVANSIFTEGKDENFNSCIASDMLHHNQTVLEFFKDLYFY